ncbi:MAG: penicillin-insensitive murein endopeptidase [Labilithrix sp.]|nr:penicillin-insensitive murein endopeptidase [Labilithrix sp.]
MPRFNVRLAVLAALLVAPAAVAGPPAKQPAHHGGRTAKRELPARRTPPGRSIGSPTEGRLVGGAHLNEAPYLRIVPVYAPGDARWGLEPLVGMIDGAARAVRRQFPDAVLSVGHLSRPGGGEIDRHASHESGRDADIGFYVRNHKGKPIFADHFVPFRGDGTAATWPGAQFDDARNWALVASIVANTQARVTYIFVASPLRARLLQYAAKVGAPAAIRTRAAELMAQPRGSLPHDDHFHVRIACPPGMDKCIERPVARRQAPPANKAAVASARGSAPAPKAAPPAQAPGRAAPPRPAPAPPPPPRSEEPESSRSDSLVPSLAPMIPGLDSVVIPAPLAGTKSASPEEKAAPPAEPVAPPAPIDDPDGVLEDGR